MQSTTLPPSFYSSSVSDGSVNGINIPVSDKTKLMLQQLFLKAIARDPKCATAYYDLGRTLQNGGSIQLLDGRTMSQRQLFYKANGLDK